MEMERKLLPLCDTEIKFLSDEKEGTLSGYASVFGGVDSYKDTVAPGAYANTIADWNAKNAQGQWLPMVDEHYGQVIGKWTGLTEDSKGLHATGELTPGHSRASDVYASLKHGAVSGLSIGYKTNKSEQTAGGGRMLKDVKLFEISVVAMPADDSARIARVKSAEDIDAALQACSNLSDLETVLRDAGRFSRKVAVAFVSRIKAIAQSDSDAERLRSLAARISAAASR